MKASQKIFEEDLDRQEAEVAAKHVQILKLQQQMDQARAELEKNEAVILELKEQRVQLDGQEAATKIAIEMLDDVIDSMSIIRESHDV